MWFEKTPWMCLYHLAWLFCSGVLPQEEHAPGGFSFSLCLKDMDTDLNLT